MKVFFLFFEVFFVLVLCTVLRLRTMSLLFYVFRQTGNMYKNVKKKIERGIAFPTCISVNNTICHYSPLASDESVLEEGDILKM